MTIPLEPAPHTAAALDSVFERLGTPGAWLHGAERVAVAREARAARACSLCIERRSAPSPTSIEGTHEDAHGNLRHPLVEATHAIATDPGHLTRTGYEGWLAQGLEPEEIVEATSIIGITTIADTLGRALSRDVHPLPTPQPGQPERRRLESAVVDRAWVPMMPPERAEGLVQAMYERVEAEAGFVFNVARALTAVPTALIDFFSVFLPNYSTHGPVRPGGLDRVQVELLASATSAYNDCFY